jgi:hypothetical protein
MKTKKARKGHRRATNAAVKDKKVSVELTSGGKKLGTLRFTEAEWSQFESLSAANGETSDATLERLIITAYESHQFDSAHCHRQELLTASRQEPKSLAPSPRLTDEHLAMLRRISLLTLMDEQTILEEVLATMPRWLENDYGYTEETMEIWLQDGMYPKKARAAAKARLNAFWSGAKFEEFLTASKASSI